MNTPKTVCLVCVGILPLAALLGEVPVTAAAPAVGVSGAVALGATVSASANASGSVVVPSLSPSASATPKELPSGTGGYTRFREAIKMGRQVRCGTALCWGGDDGMRWALEPLVELPIGKTFALPGPKGVSTLGQWVNSHDLSVSFAGGLRFWAADDLFSFSLYFSQPLTNSTGSIHVPGSEFEYTVSNLRRPYPGLALGLLGDTLWLGFDYQEIINGDTVGHYDRNYPQSSVVSRAWSLTVGLATINSVRWGIGTLASKKAEQAQENDAKDWAEKAATAAEKATAAILDATAAVVNLEEIVAKLAPRNAQPGGGDAGADADAPSDPRALLKEAQGRRNVARSSLDFADAKVEAAEAKAQHALSLASDAHLSGPRSTADAAKEETKAASKEASVLRKRLQAAVAIVSSTESTLSIQP